MQDPVALACGHILSRKPLMTCLQRYPLCPVCRNPAPSAEDVRRQAPVIMVRDMLGSMSGLIFCSFVPAYEVDIVGMTITNSIYNS